MSELTSQTVVKEMRAPVLIVGGGACGLSLSIFLSSHGVEHLLVERHPTTSHLPKAHYLNQRTMEVFRQHGLADELYAVGTPMQNMRKVRWRTTLGGDGPLDAKTFHEMDAFGGGALAETYARDSACPSSNYPQLRLEPLLRRRAQASPLATILFGHELTAISQTDSGIRATAVGLDDGTTLQITADFAVAADGGKRVGPLLGNGMSGISGLGRIVTSHIKADLSAWWDENCLITWFINPESSGALGSGAMVPMGPTWGSGSEEWVIHFGFPPGQEDLLDEEGVLPHLRELLNLPDLDIEVLKVSHWELEAVVAERYQIGNVFFAGDAAHRHPPTTGLGLNTAVQDAHNLAWKLGAVLNGRAGRALLDTYESERQPVGQRNVDWAMFTALNHQVLDAGMGFSPLQSAAQRRANFEAYFADTPMGASRRARPLRLSTRSAGSFKPTIWSSVLPIRPGPSCQMILRLRSPTPLDFTTKRLLAQATDCRMCGSHAAIGACPRTISAGAGAVSSCCRAVTQTGGMPPIRYQPRLGCQYATSRSVTRPNIRKESQRGPG